MTSVLIVDIGIQQALFKLADNRTVVLIKFDLKDSDSDSKKFFTNSHEIKYVLEQIKEMNKFPRKVTMRASGNRYYFE